MRFPRRVKTKPQPPSLIEDAARIFCALLQEESYRGFSFGKCPRCADQLYDVRARRDDSLVLMFCAVCHYWLADKSSPAWVRAARSCASSNALRDLPFAPSPDRPLDRAIQKHLQSIRRE